MPAVAEEQGRHVYLVYCRSALDGSEPLVAVVGSEAEAHGVEQLVRRTSASARVQWEVHRLPTTDAVSDVVHVVSLGTQSASEPDDRTRHVDQAEEPDPIGVAVFDRRAEAEADARRRADHDNGHYFVRSLRLGWRRPGWPFDTEG